MVVLDARTGELLWHHQLQPGGTFGWDTTQAGPLFTTTVDGDERGRIEGCLEQLDTDKADCVRGAYLDGYTYDELAQRHGVPLNTMRTWLRRSLIRLRECLSA